MTDVWLEEATEFTQADLEIIDDRLRGELPPGQFYQIRMTFNPVSKNHWIKKVFFDIADPNVLTHQSTYMGNRFIDDAYRARMERRKIVDPEGYRIYGLGEWGEVGGLILSNYVIEEFGTSPERFDYMDEYERKAKRYVKDREFSKVANEEMRIYNLTMKVNRLEMLKAKIGLALVSGHAELEEYMSEILQGRTEDELERQAGILGETVLSNDKKAEAIVNASFHNATFSDRIWMNQNLLKSELSKLLQSGLIQGKNPRVLARDLRKRFSVSISNAERLMRTELARVQTEAQKQSFERNGFEQYTFLANVGCCPICQRLNGKHFKVKDMMPGKNASPMHPNCRCSTACYEDSEEYEAWLDYLDKGGSTEEWNKMKKNSASMSATEAFIKWPKRKKSISKEDYKELSSYARDSGIVLEGFKRFDGDINTIKQVIDGANEISEKFPEIKIGRKKLTISLDEYMNPDDFAITNGHIIRINVDAFRDVETLRAEYEKLEKERWFVKGTDYRSIIKHEVGHVVANLYGIDGLEIAKKITGINSTTEVMMYLENNLSLYASEYEDGSEIISEVFADVFGTDNPSEFSLRFMDECDKIKEKGM